MGFGLRAWIRDLKYGWETYWTSGLDFQLERLEFGFRNSEFTAIGNLFGKCFGCFLFYVLGIWILNIYIFYFYVIVLYDTFTQKRDLSAFSDSVRKILSNALVRSQIRSLWVPFQTKSGNAFSGIL